MKERAITGKVLSAMRDDPHFASCAVEVKVAKGRTLGAREIKDHQRRALNLAHGIGMYYKIGDDSYGQKPFDGFVFKNAEAYVAIVFCGVRPAEVWAIKIEDVGTSSISLDYARREGYRLSI